LVYLYFFWHLATLVGNCLCRFDQDQEPPSCDNIFLGVQSRTSQPLI
jgi:hypothetical protein